MIKIRSVAYHKQVAEHISKRLEQCKEPKYVDFLTRLQATNDALLQIAQKRENIFTSLKAAPKHLQPLCDSIA